MDFDDIFPGSGAKTLSKEVQKMLHALDSGTVQMVIQTADEFVADMKKDLNKDG
jgi:hypothetical protein